MAIMNISLSDDMQSFVEAQVVEEGYASAGEYLQAVLLEVRKRKAKEELFAKLDEALASGPAELMTRDDWDAIEREAIEGLRGESINP